MNIVEFREYCLKFPKTTEDFPFNQDVLALKVKGKIFALTSLKAWEEGDPRVNLKCDPEKAQELRAKYPESVLPGFHMNKKHWNSVMMNSTELSEKKKFYLINHSFELVVSKLPIRARRTIQGLQ